ncbi:MAG: hypothetical protein IH831_02405 [Planctomycetes bacterium]|nr:hypothetical protein [Planctomycetota bacterium]
MSELLVVISLTAHLLTMNLASAGPLVCLWLRGRKGVDVELADQLGRSLAWLSLWAMVVGMFTGGLLLLTPSSEPMWEALDRFPAEAYRNAGLELLFSLVCLLVYAGGWRLFGQHRRLHAVFALLSATNLFYHFPPLMAVLGKLAANRSWTTTPIIDRPALLELMARDNVISLSAHFALASIAVAGLTALWLLAGRGERNLENAEARRVARVTAGIALISTILQLPVGMWVLATMSHASRAALMGKSPLASLLFLAGVLLAVLLIGRLLAVVLGEVRLREIRRAGWLLLLATLLMTATMRLSRAHGYGGRPQEASSASCSPSSSCSCSPCSCSSSCSGSFCTSSNGPPGSLLALINSP